MVAWKRLQALTITRWPSSIRAERRSGGPGQELFTRTLSYVGSVVDESSFEFPSSLAALRDGSHVLFVLRRNSVDLWTR